MRVIKSGKSKKWIQKCKCTGKGYSDEGCSAQLEVEQSDLYYNKTFNKHTDKIYATFKCPECGVESDIEAPVGIKLAKDVSLENEKYDLYEIKKQGVLALRCVNDKINASLPSKGRILGVTENKIYFGFLEKLSTVTGFRIYDNDNCWGWYEAERFKPEIV